jgi:hypothetical protein
MIVCCYLPCRESNRKRLLGRRVKKEDSDSREHGNMICQDQVKEERNKKINSPETKRETYTHFHG